MAYVIMALVIMAQMEKQAKMAHWCN